MGGRYSLKRQYYCHSTRVSKHSVHQDFTVESIPPKGLVSLHLSSCRMETSVLSSKKRGQFLKEHIVLPLYVSESVFFLGWMLQSNSSGNHSVVLPKDVNRPPNWAPLPISCGHRNLSSCQKRSKYANFHNGHFCEVSSHHLV